MKEKIQKPKPDPELFNKTYQTINKSYAILFISYILTTSFFYFSSSIIEIPIYRNLFLFVIVILNYYSYFSKSGYTLLTINILLFIGNIVEIFAFDYSPMKSNEKNESLQKNLSILYFFTIFSSFICLFTYCFYYFFTKINVLRRNFKGMLSYEVIYHEIQLQVDMLKMSFNRFLLRTGLNKTFPYFVYRKESFYYQTNEALMISNRLDEQRKHFENSRSKHENVDGNENENEKFIKKEELYSNDTCHDSFM